MLAATAAAAAASAANPYFIASCSCSSFHLIQRPRRRPRSPSLSLFLPFTALASSRSSPNSQTLVDSDLGFCGAPRLLSCWSGLKQLTISSPSFPPNSAKRRKLRGKVVYASLFGVGAPEVLVIGVVALLVFGPKGLAEVARNLGKTLRAFQPTIRELQDVSREFKSTLEREIGLDDVTSSTNNTFNSVSNENQQARIDPNGAPKPAAYTSEDLLKITQEQLAASAAGSQSPVSSPPQDQQEAESTSNVVADASSKVTASSTPEAAGQIQPSEKPEEC